MKYIVHHRFKKQALCGEVLNLPYGTELNCVGGYILTEGGKAICTNTSENAKRHFASNHDGKGLERGKLTYAIAYSKRNKGKGFRFSEEERKLLVTKWKHFLRTDLDVILFNDSFFEASISGLRKLADELKIKIKE